MLKSPQKTALSTRPNRPSIWPPNSCAVWNRQVSLDSFLVSFDLSVHVRGTEFLRSCVSLLGMFHPSSGHTLDYGTPFLGGTYGSPAPSLPTLDKLGVTGQRSCPGGLCGPPSPKPYANKLASERAIRPSLAGSGGACCAVRAPSLSCPKLSQLLRSLASSDSFGVGPSWCPPS